MSNNVYIEQVSSKIKSWKEKIYSIEKEDKYGSLKLRDGEKEAFQELKEFWKYNSYNPDRCISLINELKKHENYHAPRWEELGEFRRICLLYYTKERDVFEAFQNALGGKQKGLEVQNLSDEESIKILCNGKGDYSEFVIKSIGQTVTIGTQVWMTKNLDVDRFRNGDPIPEVKTNEEWENAGENEQPAWCYYDNNPKNGEKYGKLYNWYAVKDSRGLAPIGYHIPSYKEWSKLTDNLGGEEVAGYKMKSTSGWVKNGNGSNSSGFSGLPGGHRYDDGTFDNIGEYADWWSSTEFGSYTAWHISLDCKSGSVSSIDYMPELGFSVRCLKD
jgi:uncharacterized protein (TIGR02145 family)